MRLKGLLLPIILPAFLSACADIPRDPGETLERVRERGTIRLGEIEGVEPDPASERVLDRLAQRTGAKVVRIKGHGEELLEGLEEDRIDLVYGRFADDSPWATAVYFGTPPGRPDKPPKSMRVARFAFRLGENGWITKVEEAAK